MNWQQQATAIKPIETIGETIMRNKITATLQMQSIECLKEQAEALSYRFDDGANCIFEEILNILESRMDEESFVAFARGVYE